MKFKGAIKKIGETVTGVGAKGEWSKTQLLVEEIDCEYPNSIVFDAFNKNIDGFALGMVVNIEYNARATEYNGKLYNSFLIYTIENNLKKHDVKSEPALSVPNPPNPIDGDDDGTDQLPF
jgi:hypothetical protein